jgi:PKD repeat protein
VYGNTPEDYSIELPPGDVASGADDAELKTFIASTPKNIILTNDHEPEEEIDTGQYTFAQFRAGIIHLAALVHAQNAVDGGTRRVSVILMYDTVTGDKGRNPMNYWPGADANGVNYADLISFDTYALPHNTNTPGVPRGFTDGIKWVNPSGLLNPLIAFAKQIHSPWMISELGYLEDVNDPAHKASAITDAVNYARLNGAIAVEYWDSFGTRGDWQLRYSTAATNAWKSLVDDTSTPANSAPVAAGSASCQGLTCSFDGSGSTDSDGTVASYAWDFGDGTTGTGETPTHLYAAAGNHTYSLTVTDDQGATSAAFQGTVATTSSSTQIGFVAAAHAVLKPATVAAGASVTAPLTVQAGDTELLFVSSAAIGATGTPAGWTQVAQQNSSPLQVRVFKNTAGASDAGSTVKVPVLTSTPVVLQLLDYRGAGSAVTAVGAADTNATTHKTPVGTVSTPGSWVLSYWSDKTATTTGWTLPASLTKRDVSVGTGGGHVTGALADSGAPVAVGSYPSQSASVIGTGVSKGAMLTVVLPPS